MSESTPSQHVHESANHNEEGFVLIFVALCSLVLLVFAALAVDVGALYSRGLQAQRAADAAATAGVVYLPGNLVKAREVALQSAKDNGFDPGADSEIVVTAVQGNTPRRLKVTIQDKKVETIFARFFKPSFDLSRTGTAEFVSKIPLGSAFNAIGTGSLTGQNNDGSVQNFFLAVNGFCTAKEDGDQRLSGFDGNRGRSNPDVYSCGAARDPWSGTAPSVNSDFVAGTSAYEYVIDVPCARPDPSVDCDPTLAATQPVTVQIYNPAFDLSEQTQAETGFTSGYVADPDAPRPDTRTLFRRSDPDGSSRQSEWESRWDNTAMTTVFNLLRPTTDSGVWRQTDPAAPASVAPSPTAIQSTAEKLFGTCDNDPVTPAAVRPECSSDDAGWYTFTVLPTAGRWKVRVYTLENELGSFGVNAFAIRAFTGPSFTTCDTRTAPSSCPGVSGDTAMSVLAKSSNPGATEFFLSRLAPAEEFRGKRVQVSLWDAGEGMSKIEVLDPVGRKVTFGCELGDRGLTGPNELPESASPSGCPTNALTVAGGSPQNPAPWLNGDTRFNNAQYNDRMLQLLIDVPTDYGLDGFGNPIIGFDGWWKIRYTPKGSGKVVDRSTWSVEVVGDPVHLITE
jgi:Putative Flp pilus-assembly TadE/G-like